MQAFQKKLNNLLLLLMKTYDSLGLGRQRAKVHTINYIVAFISAAIRNQSK